MKESNISELWKWNAKVYDYLVSITLERLKEFHMVKNISLLRHKECNLFKLLRSINTRTNVRKFDKRLKSLLHLVNTWRLSLYVEDPTLDPIEGM